MVWPDYFGIAALGAVKGVVNSVRNGATALGPLVAAALVSSAGSFAPALICFAGAALAAGVLAFLLPPPRSFPAAATFSSTPEYGVGGD